jgi:hypothetical protein
VPLVVREGAVDYALADRSKGPAVWDLRLGQLARWVGLININQVNQSLKTLCARAGQGEPGSPMGDLMVEEGLIDQHQLSALLRVLAAPRDEAEEEVFGNVAAQNEFTTPERAAECLALQKQAAAEGRQAPFIGFVLMEKRYVSDHQVMAILRASQRRGRGLIVEYQDALAAMAPPARTRPVRERKGVKWQSLRRSPVLAIVAATVLLFAVFRIYQTELRGPRARSYPVDIMCKACKARYRQAVKTRAPFVCRECGKSAAFQALKCRNEKCGAVFAWESPPGPEPLWEGRSPPPMMMDAAKLPQCPECEGRRRRAGHAVEGSE